MNFKQQQIFFWSSRIPLLLLYIPFLIVQGFFNLDSQFPNNQIATSITKKQVVCQKGITSFHSNKTENKESHIRLNKRFQPENTPVVVPPILEISACIITTNLFYTYSDPQLPSFYFYVNKLRGPPAVV